MSSNKILSTEQLNKLRRVEEFIRQNIRYHYTIHELSQRFEMNEVVLKMGFKQLYELPVYRYLENERIKKSCVLLIETKMPVSDITPLIGYTYVTNFIATFKRKLGITPIQYRQESSVYHP